MPNAVKVFIADFINSDLWNIFGVFVVNQFSISN